MPAPAILYAVHNISSRLRKQLILDLEVWVGGLELLEQLPSRVLVRQAAPLNEHSPNSSVLLGLQGAFGFRKNALIMRRWYGTRRRWWRTVMLLEETDMEHIMKTRAGR
jgi:hypothetical protein